MFGWVGLVSLEAEGTGTVGIEAPHTEMSTSRVFSRSACSPANAGSQPPVA